MNIFQFCLLFLLQTLRSNVKKGWRYEKIEFIYLGLFFEGGRIFLEVIF